MEIIIGADELILWLRKNRRAINENNLQLGRKILLLIQGLGGMKHIDNHKPLWDTKSDDGSIGEYALPQTSEQYRIPVEILPAIYREIDSW